MGEGFWTGGTAPTAIPTPYSLVPPMDNPPDIVYNKVH